MNTHYSTNITRQIPAAGGDRQILDRVQSVGVDHEVSVIFVDCRSLASVTTVEELCHCFLFQGVDRMHIEPRCVTGENDGMCLGNEMRTS